jgi:hypothetical protein
VQRLEGQFEASQSQRRCRPSQPVAAAVVSVHDDATSVREWTLRWFARNALSLSLASSLEMVAEAYEPSQPRARPRDIAK